MSSIQTDMLKKRKNAALYILISIIGLFLLIALIAPAIAPNQPDKTNLTVALQGPNNQFPLGTDHLGRCILSRLLYGASVSLFSSIGIIAIVFLYWYVFRNFIRLFWGDFGCSNF